MRAERRRSERLARLVLLQPTTGFSLSCDAPTLRCDVSHVPRLPLHSFFYCIGRLRFRTDAGRRLANGSRMLLLGVLSFVEHR
mmetsp:Transcript_4203/g.6248  ORF Transcript_4203/g.6248 Transcript_4203/m.6248 type:complete len:83 (-) Transcript_4203:564-812(-)